MSIEAYKAVWAITDIRGTEKLTLMAIAEFASRHNAYTCEASIATIAKMTGVSERQTKKVLHSLESQNYINTSRNVGRGNTNIYSIAHLIKGELEFTNYGQEKVNSSAEKVNSSAEKVNSSTLKGELEFTQTINNPMNRSNLEGDPVMELLDHFCKTAYIPPPKSINGENDSKWLAPLISIYRASGESFEKTKVLISEAIEYMGEKEWHIANPGSIVSTASKIARSPKRKDTPEPGALGQWRYFMRGQDIDETAQDVIKYLCDKMEITDAVLRNPGYQEIFMQAYNDEVVST